MDGTRFDALTRTFAQSGSRRRLLGGLVAGALGLVGLREADAVACRTGGQGCREHVDCCSGICNPPAPITRQRLCEGLPTTTTSTTTGTTSTTTTSTTTSTTTTSTTTSTTTLAPPFADTC